MTWQSSDAWEQYRGDYRVQMKHGFEMYLRPGCSHSKRRFLYRVLEKRELDWLEGRDWSGFTAIDVGANVGYWSCFLASRIGPTGQLHSFEPDPVSARILRKNLGWFSTPSHVAEIAVSNMSGKATLHLDQTQSGLNSLAPLSSESLSVEVTTLDAYVDDCTLDRVDFIKIDVQGEEIGVLEGAQSLIERDRPTIYMEWDYEFQTEDGPLPYGGDHAERTTEMLRLTRSLGAPYKFTEFGIVEISELNFADFSGNLLFNPPRNWCND